MPLLRNTYNKEILYLIFAAFLLHNITQNLNLTGFDRYVICLNASLTSQQLTLSVLVLGYVDAQHNSAPRGGFWVWMRLFIVLLQLWKRSAAVQAPQRWTAVWQRASLSLQLSHSKWRAVRTGSLSWSTNSWVDGFAQSAAQHNYRVLLLFRIVRFDLNVLKVFEGLCRYFVLKLPIFSDSSRCD